MGRGQWKISCFRGWSHRSKRLARKDTGVDLTSIRFIQQTTIDKPESMHHSEVLITKLKRERGRPQTKVNYRLLTGDHRQWTKDQRKGISRRGRQCAQIKAQWRDPTQASSKARARSCTIDLLHTSYYLTYLMHSQAFASLPQLRVKGTTERTTYSIDVIFIHSGQAGRERKSYVNVRTNLKILLFLPLPERG